MTLIGFQNQGRNQQHLAEHIVEELVHPDFPQSWNLVIPPGFGEAHFLGQLASLLRGHSQHPLVAVIHWDRVPSVEEVIRDIHRQWCEVTTLPPLKQQPTAGRLLQELYQSLPGDRCAVQVFGRFHKVIEHADNWILGALRDAEAEHQLRTFTATPVTLDELKLRWRAEGHVFSWSDYGDTHAKQVVSVLPEEEVLEIAEQSGISRKVAEFFLGLTGGYPELFQECYKLWQRRDKQLRPEVKEELYKHAGSQSQRFVTWLDSKDRSAFRDAVVDLYHHANSDNAIQRLQLHQWSELLMDKDGNLRADCVGLAAERASIQAAARWGRFQEVELRNIPFAEQLYRRKQYSKARDVLHSLSQSRLPENARLFFAHARIMAILFQGEWPDENTDWGQLTKEVEGAEAVLGNLNVDATNQEILRLRYCELKELATNLSRATLAARNCNDDRLIDLLVGLRKEPPGDCAAAAFLLLLKYQAGMTIPSNTLACQSVLSLPEQVFRVWAWWRLNINYYEAPVGADEAWEEAARNWQVDRRGPLVRAAPGREFPSFRCFVYFTLGTMLQSRRESCEGAPVDGFSAAEKALGFYEPVRNREAHALCMTRANIRQKYFDLINNWLEPMLAACPKTVTRRELLSKISPLPSIDQAGCLSSD